ncbi:MAG: carbohydrate ABC transporter permease [Caldilineaceae bacterium]|nr:carbohydrate ABC transporter permease [Caldilineaceae bacterium]MCY3992202.1 carbohydrate ABC transporter permease [Caldilineaceae bacterium]MDE0080581.1 carbohydrate ABC transporter permease [Caldilineaceae bacterium]MDE0311407.1 carbohydrate ABC transporter permease [Caldilineaceae bacterium]
MNVWQEARQSRRVGIVATGLLDSLLVLGGLLTISPFIWMLVVSFGQSKELLQMPPNWFPWPPYLASYQEAFHYVNFLVTGWNSLKVTCAICAGQLFTCSLAAFAFARLRFPGREALFIILLSALMIPPQMTIIPVYVMLAKVDMIDTHTSLILPAFFSATGTFLLRQFFLTMPQEMVDAAKIDGATYWTIYWRIFLPLGAAGISALAIFCFNFHWNELFRPLIFLNSVEKFTLPLALSYINELYVNLIGVTYAAVAMAVIPVLIVFLMAQRYLIEGITLTGLKEG